MILAVPVSHGSSCPILFRMKQFSLFCTMVLFCSFYNPKFKKWSFSTTVGHH